MQGKKTHEQQMRILESKDDVPSPPRSERQTQADVVAGSAKVQRRGGRESEFPVSSAGMNQESDHNKHKHPTQQNHTPVRLQPAQQKQD